ncbi:MAG: alpha/beta fold hydrolase, partial [Deltaproteobacteria bacterium]|nr:alpha/beta fold hydrolase [Deltaproteobacteria bacterium]
LRQDMAKAVRLFSPKMAKVMSAARLKTAWARVVAQAGDYKSVKAVRLQRADDATLVIYTIVFSRQSLDLQLTIDGRGRVAGMFYRSAPEETKKKPLPAYADRARVKEIAVEVGHDPWKLPGKLTIPKEIKGSRTSAKSKTGKAISARRAPFPAVILVHGSGPHDADETIGPNKPFRDLAWGLSTRGVAVLRYAKRTLTHRAAVTRALEKLTLKEETIDDALAAADLLRKRKDIDPKRIYVLGHSLGGYALPRIARRSHGRLAGLIFMAANSRPLEELILAQFVYLSQIDGRVTGHEKRRLDRLREKMARLKKDLKQTTPRQLLPLNLTAGYWLDLRAHSPLKAIRKVRLPMLFLQGERDYQVTLEDLAGWKKVLGRRRNVVFKTYKKANHLLIDGKGLPRPQEYKH